MEKSYYRFRFSAFQAIGIIMTILGILVLVLTGIFAVKPDRSGDKTLHYDSSTDENEAESSVSGEEYAAPSSDSGDEESGGSMNAKNKVFSAAPGLLLGAALIIFAVPMFYIPYDEGFRFRRRRKRRKDDDMSDKEFDYPDDEFDYILDEETRKKLLEEKFRRIYEKHHNL